jgi:FkbM family methyltransferase
MRQDPWLRLDASLTTKLIGTAYGGWYVATNLLPPQPRVLSLGIGSDVSFDAAMIRDFGASVTACDPTPIAAETVANAAFPTQHFCFLAVAVSDFDGMGVFEPVVVNGTPSGCFRLTAARSNPDSMTVRVQSLDTVIQTCFDGEIDLMKMDIEGAEYQVIDALLKLRWRPRQIAVEFHHRFPSHGLVATVSAIRALRQAGYRLVAMSDHGPEYTFVHQSAIQ